MPTSSDAEAVPETAPPSRRATRAIGHRPRMMTFRRIVTMVTVVIHVPFAVAVAVCVIPFMLTAKHRVHAVVSVESCSEIRVPFPTPMA